jgi:uracil-DNA glycosylase
MTKISTTSLVPAAIEPDRNCPLCPRLADFRAQARARQPDWFNSPVSSFGDVDARLLIVGLAPGLQGANRTGRPFTGDHAGLLLYQTLYEAGLASRPQSHSADDGLQLINVRIVNAVKCVPPQNKPLPAEVRCCNGYLAAELQRLRSVRVYLALGRVAHDGLLMAFGLRRTAHPFGHGREHALDPTRWLIDSYHCSRYNTATGRLTAAMFRQVVARACERAALPGRRG